MIKWGLFWYSIYCMSGITGQDVQNTWTKGQAYGKGGWLDDSNDRRTV